tara:strand:+ start:317 stop:580 length:264 start_codon:yes stop_codon:yes gene_type:complete
MDKALRGNRLTKQRKTKGPSHSMTRQPPEEIDSLEALGIMSSGGIEGKPHSTKEGRRYAGARHLTRFWYGRGKDYTDFKKKKKGTPV